MAFCSNHNRIYFDALNRAKKAETILSLIYATYQTKLNKDNLQKSEKEIIAEKLKYAYELFKFDVGSYDGDVNSFDSQYTIGHEMGIWINSDLDLSSLATKVAEGYMTIKDYLSVVFLNYIQPVNGKMLHILHCLLTYMHNNELSSITKEQMADAYNLFIPDSAPQASVNAVFNYMIATNYFNQTGKKELTFNSKYDIKNIINLCDVTYLDETKYTYEQVKEKFKDLKLYLEYLLNEHIDEKIIEDDYNNDTFLILENEAKENYTIEELGQILREMHDTAKKNLGDKINDGGAVHVFGIQYGNVIRENKYPHSKIIEASGLPDSYSSILGRAVAAYDFIKSGKYGLKFYEGEDDFEKKTKELPSLPKRTRKKHPLNCILYGAPGTGKTYATAKYALAITENKELDDYVGVARNTIMDQYNELIKNGQVVFTTFHQNYGYEDFIQGIRPDTTTSEMRFKTVDGVFKKIADKAMDNPEKDYVIIIDEINRANISKVFGELITLIEDDKRWGEENAVSATLPSDEIFAVPNNLYILGTMNSADKSISLIDAALRRRFDFVEFVPSLELIADKKLKDLLNKLNNGIAAELNSTDLLVGHSYFIDKKAEDVYSIMNRSIIPLLYEYFFDNKKKVEDHLKTALEGFDVEIISNSMGRITIKKKEV